MARHKSLKQKVWARAKILAIDPLITRAAICMMPYSCRVPMSKIESGACMADSSRYSRVRRVDVRAPFKVPIFKVDMSEGPALLCS